MNYPDAEPKAGSGSPVFCFRSQLLHILRKAGLEGGKGRGWGRGEKKLRLPDQNNNQLNEFRSIFPHDCE